MVVCLFISTKAADRLPRDPKENCLRGRQKLSTSSCKDLFEEENKFPAKEVDVPTDELFKYETQTLGESLLQTHPYKKHLAKNLAQEKMKTESKHKGMMEIRNAGMP